MSDTCRFFRAVACMMELEDGDCLDHCLAEAHRLWYEAHSEVGISLCDGAAREFVYIQQPISIHTVG